MQTRLMLRLVVVIGLVTPLASCQFLETVKAMRTFKDANTMYQRGDYQGAAEAYEQVLARDPNLTPAYFYLANSYDNLYKPGRRGEPENDGYLDKAIGYYNRSIERESDPAMKRLAMQYLVAAYGADKKNDPNGAEPVLRQMIDLDPGEPDNYYALAKLYEDAGLYEDAESVLLKVREMRPDDTVVYMQLAGFYNRNGEFEKTMDALQERATREPGNPEAFYTIATFYWEKAFRDFRLAENEKRQYVMSGLEAIDQALSLNENYSEALVYKNILLRMQANMEKDVDKQKALIAEADRLRSRAEELQKQKTS